MLADELARPLMRWSYFFGLGVLECVSAEFNETVLVGVLVIVDDRVLVVGYVRQIVIEREKKERM